jgi:hypothetical protein
LSGTGLTLDAGALIAFDRGNRLVVAAIEIALEEGATVTIPAAVVGQAWRDGRRQARLARLLADAGVTVEPLDDAGARAAGQLCGVMKTADVIDASVVLCARRRGDTVLTSDVGDLRQLDPTLRLVAV